MNRCVRVCEADAITGHSHSILVAFRNDTSESSSKVAGITQHVPICYMKADTTEEIRWYFSFVLDFIKWIKKEAKL